MPINSFAEYPMSWKPARAGLKRPIYLSLAQRLESDIGAGLLAPGTKLPPQRELADFLDINFTTVTRAYKLCELKGLVVAETGRGTFVSPRAARSVTISADHMVRECIDLAFGASFEQCNGMIAETARRVMAKPYFDRLLDYTDPSGMPHQKQAALHWLRSFGLEAQPQQMAIVSGAQNGLVIALLALFQPGDRIAVDTYTFANLIELAKLHHLHLVPVRGDRQGMLPEELEAQCKLNEVRGVFLMPSCSNPTAVTIPEDRKRQLAHVIRKYGLLLVEDDTHAFLTAGVVPGYEGPIYRLLPEQTVYICSTSKAICSGLRVAYLVFGEPLRERILHTIYNVNIKTPSLNAEIVTELLLTGRAGEIMEEKKRLAAQANALFNGCFPAQAQNGHPLAFFRWLPVSTALPGEQLEKQLEKRGIRVFHSDRFLSGPALPQKYLRIALSTADSLAHLQAGLGILRDALLT